LQLVLVAVLTLLVVVALVVSSMQQVKHFLRGVLIQ
jgi:heme exporter protein D